MVLEQQSTPFDQFLNEILDKAGLIALMFVPSTYRHDEREDLIVAIPRDEFVGDGGSHQLNYLDKVLNSMIQIKERWSVRTDRDAC